ncbi:MAG: hypothetical protein ACOCWQ_02830, partial [Nanoarchaeota archaeon]
TRFHLVFFVRAPNVERFVAITKKIVDNLNIELTEADIAFLQDFVSYAEDIKVDFPDDLKKRIVEFTKGLKSNEKDYLVDISPRLVHGIVRLATASARISLRRKVLDHDLEVAERIMKTSLEIVK